METRKQLVVDKNYMDTLAPPMQAWVAHAPSPERLRPAKGSNTPTLLNAITLCLLQLKPSPGDPWGAQAKLLRSQITL